MKLSTRLKGYLAKKLLPDVVRSWQAGGNNRFLNDWTQECISINRDLKSDLKTIRARTRDLVQNSPFFNKYLSMREKNIFGPDGIRLQMKVRDANGKLDSAANKEIEGAWRRWCRSVNCTVDKNKTLLDVLKLLDVTKETAGEFFVQKVVGYPNDFNFSLKILDPNACDLEKNQTRRASDPQIVMGIKKDSWGATTSYYFKLQDDPYDYTFSPQRYIEIPSSEIIHGYVERVPGQVRGYPQAAAILFNLQMLKGYSEAEVMAARANACKMGFFTTPAGETVRGMADGKTDDQYQINIEPLTFQQLPAGSEFKTFDTQNPNANYSSFVQTQLREVASSLDISYNFLHSNMEAVNFSSLRSAALDERDRWRMEQNWYIEHVLQPIFDQWLDMYLLSGNTSLPYAKKWKFQAATWMPRSYQWVDPRKDAQANVLLMEKNIIAPQDLISERGEDPEDVLELIREWREQTKDLVNATAEKKELPL